MNVVKKCSCSWRTWLFNGLLLAGLVASAPSGSQTGYSGSPTLSQTARAAGQHSLSGLKPVPAIASIHALGGGNGSSARKTPDPGTVAIGKRLTAAMAALDQGNGQAPTLPAVSTNGHPKPWLVPPEAEFSEAQLAVLADLRWRSGKHIEARGNAENKTIRFLEGLSLEPPAEKAAAGLSLAETTARNFLERNHELLLLKDPSTELEQTELTQDGLGYTQVRYEQRHEGLEVWPAGLTVQLDRAGHAHVVSGAYVPTPDTVGIVPGLDMEHASDRARGSLGLDMAAPIERQELIVYAPIDGETRLAYRIELHAAAFDHRLVVVDAISGAILESINQVCSAATVGSGTDLRGQTRSVNLWSANGRHYMVDASKPMFNTVSSDPPSPGMTFGGIILLDAKGVDPSKNPAAYAPEVIFSTSTSSGFPSAGISASFNLSIVHDYFLERHQRNSINGQGGTIVGVINVPINNAFWNQGVITLGSADAWAESLDFVGHEMAHGVTERTAGLIYRNQSGAMNEAFSDIFGEAAEAYHRGQTDWQIGSQLATRSRDMKDPAAFEIANGRRYPSRMSEFIPANDPFLGLFGPGRDNGGVHFNSSIINHAFYHLAEGLPGAIGLLAAERIFYRALTTKLRQQSQFIDCRLACVQSAIEIFGAGSPEAIRTGEAFNVVEIFDQAPTPGPTPVPEIAGPDALVFTFVDQFSGLTFLARREASQGDPVNGVLLFGETPMAPFKRPAVLGDGSRVMAVTANNDIALVDTRTGQGQTLGLVGQVWSVGMSVDGQFAAIILRDEFGQPRNQINVFRMGTDEVESYDLLAPTLDGGSIGTVLYGDTLDFSLDGNFLYYDALNRLRFSDGSVFDNWSIYVIDRGTGLEFEVVRPIPGLNLGNPSLGNIHNHRLVFEAQNPAAFTSTIYGMDLVSGGIGAIFTVNSAIAVGYPNLNGDDTVLYFSDYFFSGGFLNQGIIGTIPLTADGLSFSGDASPTLTGNAAGPLICAVYRRGTFSGLPAIQVEATVPVTSSGGAPPGLFTLTRTGSTTEALPVSYILTGTARNGTDYFGVSLSATIAAGSSNTTVSILAFEGTPRDGDQTVILNLTPASHYIFGAADSALVTIVDESEPGDEFAAWALIHGVTGETGNGDGDRYSNLLEFALGTDPNAEDPADLIRGELVTVGQQRYLSLVVSRTSNNGAVLYEVEVADALGGPWNSGPPHTVEVENTATRLVVRDAGGIGTSPGRFMRLKVGLR